MAKPLSFYNDATFIRVENSTTGVTSYFNKASTLLQCDHDTSFMIKSDDLQVHYLYADVQRPEADSQQALLQIFHAWIEEFHQVYAASPLLTDSTSTVLDVKVLRDANAAMVSELVRGAASSTLDANSSNQVTMHLTTAAQDRIVRQSKTYAMLTNNKVAYAVLTSRLHAGSSAPGATSNVTCRVGLFDDAEDVDVGIPGAAAIGSGVFFQHKAADGMSLVIRSHLGDTVVAQADWNLDTLDSHGPSGATLDPSQDVTYVFELRPGKAGVLRVGIMNDGNPLYCHAVEDFNRTYESVPLRWELRRERPGEVGDAAAMTQGSGCVMLQGPYEATCFTRSKASSVIKNVVNSAAPKPIWSLRLRPADNRCRLLPKRFCIMNMEAGVATWTLLLNPSSLTAASYADVSESSYAQFSDAETSIVGGIVLATGHVSAQAAQTIEIDDKHVMLAADVAGVSDVLSLQVQYLRGTVTIVSSVEWSELD